MRRELTKSDNTQGAECATGRVVETHLVVSPPRKPGKGVVYSGGQGCLKMKAHDASKAAVKPNPTKEGKPIAF